MLLCFFRALASVSKDLAKEGGQKLLFRNRTVGEEGIAVSTGNEHVFGDEVETITVCYDGDGMITSVTSDQFPDGLPGNQVTWGSLVYEVGQPMPRFCAEGTCSHNTMVTS